MHEMYGCQPAICALAVANMSRPLKMQWLPGARVAPPGARYAYGKGMASRIRNPVARTAENHAAAPTPVRPCAVAYDRRVMDVGSANAARTTPTRCSCWPRPRARLCLVHTRACPCGHRFFPTTPLSSHGDCPVSKQHISPCISHSERPTRALTLLYVCMRSLCSAASALPRYASRFSTSR